MTFHLFHLFHLFHFFHYINVANEKFVKILSNIIDEFSKVETYFAFLDDISYINCQHEKQTSSDKIVNRLVFNICKRNTNLNDK
jgi:hypothetical protein